MNPVFTDVFTEIAVLLLVASIIGIIGMRLRQPMIVAFIAVGILVGPMVLGLFHFNPLKESALLEVLTEVAVLISLFAAGINFLLFGLIANMVVKTGKKRDERLHEITVFSV